MIVRRPTGVGHVSPPLANEGDIHPVVVGQYENYLLDMATSPVIKRHVQQTRISVLGILVRCSNNLPEHTRAAAALKDGKVDLAFSMVEPWAKKGSDFNWRRVVWAVGSVEYGGRVF